MSLKAHFMDFAPQEIKHYYATRVPSLSQTNGREWRGACPIHSGKNPNFAVNSETGLAKCHSACGRGWDVISLEQELSACDFPVAKARVFQIIGRPEPKWEERDFEAMYDYTDDGGNVLYQVVRKFGKRFSQRRPDGSGGWNWGLGSVVPVPFRLTRVAPAGQAWITEGEKDVLTLERLGLVATCNNGGAGNFKAELRDWFKGKAITILPDNDEPGRHHALSVAALLSPVARSIRILELPGLPEKGDVTDFVNAGGSKADLEGLYAKAKDWTPDWQFALDVPNENDKYVRTLVEVIEEHGGLENFWDLQKYEGLPTPWPKLTHALAGGLRNGEVYVIGANQGEGKTSLAMQFALKAGRDGNLALIYSMEMGHRDVFQRMASIDARVDLIEFRKFQRDRSEFLDFKEMRLRLQRSTNEIAGYPLLVSRKASITPAYLLAETERLSKRQKIKLVIIDHMQLMGAASTVRGEYEKFTAISRATKQTAVELNVPVILVSQTSRSNSRDKRTEIEVSDLRGSGAIEEDACTVMLLYHDAEDKVRAEGSGTFITGPVKTWLKLGKNRFGWQGAYIEFLHFKSFTRFDPAEATTP